MNRFDGQALHTFGQISRFSKQTLAQGDNVKQGQLIRVIRQVPRQELVFILRVRA